MTEGKSAKAYRTISEVAESLGVPQHVLRFWETKFPAVKPLKRGGNRRYYRPEDIELLQVIHRLLHVEGYTIKGAQKLLKERGARSLVDALLNGAEGAAGQPVPLALAAAAAAPAEQEAVVAEADEAAEAVEAATSLPAAAPADREPAAAMADATAVGETPAVAPAALSAEIAVCEAAPAADHLNGETLASDGAAEVEAPDLAVAATLMPATAGEAAPERPAGPGAAPVGSSAERQRRSAVLDELRAIRARLADALETAAVAAR